MHITVVGSKTLSTVGYDSARNLLQLEFRSRTVYRYFDIPATVYEALLAAPSKGNYFNRVIRGRYAYVRVPEMQAAQREQAGGSAWHGR
jgi:hypothetical protein